MNLENLDGYGFHEMVFDSDNPHVIIHYNTQNNNISTHWHTPIEILMPIENIFTAYVNNKEYILLDTAGIRKKSKVEYGVEKFAVARAIRAIENSDIKKFND